MSLALQGMISGERNGTPNSQNRFIFFGGSVNIWIFNQCCFCYKDKQPNEQKPYTTLKIIRFNMAQVI